MRIVKEETLSVRRKDIIALEFKKRGARVRNFLVHRPQVLSMIVPVFIQESTRMFARKEACRKSIF